jgi:hypothetical protein
MHSLHCTMQYWHPKNTRGIHEFSNEPPSDENYTELLKPLDLKRKID